MIKLRPLVFADIGTIRGWPPYPMGFECMDYALRSKGWLAGYMTKPDTWCFAAEEASELVAFTILSKTGPLEAEFRIALRADQIGQGFGRAIATQTLAKGFSEIGLFRIHFIVRKINPGAIRLYERLGFVGRGECSKNIDGKETLFLVMDISNVSYQKQRLPE